MCASFSRFSLVWNRRRQEESRRSPAQTAVSTGGRARSSISFCLCSADQGVHDACTFFLEEAWTCARRTTDRDLASQRHKGECPDTLTTDDNLPQRVREKEKHANLSLS